MDKRNFAEPGSVSHGTMREEDLIPCFLDVLESIDPEVHASAVKEGIECRVLYPKAPHCIRAYPFKGYHDRALIDSALKLSGEFTEYLFDKLDTFAPEGHYFGAHPGDGCDYGFWPCGDDCDYGFWPCDDDCDYGFWPCDDDCADE